MKQHGLLTGSLIGLLMVLWGLTACSPVKPPPKYYYNLTTNTPNMKSHSSGPVLLVTLTSAEPPYNTNKIAYTQQERPYQVSYFGEHYWASAPAKLMTINITNAMVASQHFKAVANPPYGGTANYRLDTDLTSLVQQFHNNTSTETLSLRAVIVNAQNNQILRSRNFTVTQPVSANNPEAGVVAANKALTVLMQQLQVWVIGLTP